MGRRYRKRARKAKRRKSEEHSNEEEYLAASDFDGGSGGSDTEMKNMRDLKRKGKAVIDVSDDGEEAWLSMNDLRVGGNGDYPAGKGEAVIDVSDEEQGIDDDMKEYSVVGSGGEYSVEDSGGEYSVGSESDIDVPSVSFAHSHQKKTKKKKKRGKNDPPLLWEIWEEENKKWVDAHEADDIDVDNIDANVAAIVEPPPDLLLPLMRFQKEYLAWAIKQEESDVRGGILADEMGMGKTIQAISLVLTTRAIRPIGSGDSGETASTSSLSLPKIKSTLVICPVVAVSQWKNEIAKFTAKGSTRVLVYHGAKRDRGFDQFSEYDFVLTTYSTIEADYRKNVMPPKEKCQWCGKLLLPQKMATHQRYYCGPDAVKTVKQSKQMRKKKQPLKVGESIKTYSLAEDGTWETEFGKGKEPGKSKKRSKQQKKIKISNSNANSTAAGQESSTRKSVLHCVKWNRIILDEAHFIKDRRSSTARAVFALESSYKWALSGTPLQNRVGELYSLIRFLQISPYSYYFCKDCDCKILDYSSRRECPSCVHSTVRHFFWWNKYVAKPIQSRGYANEGRRALILLKHKLLKCIVLRRTKKSRAADLALPLRIVSLRRDMLDNKEEDFYEALYSNSQSQFNTYVAEGTLMNNYAHIFDLLTRLRQAVDHPYLVVYPRTRAPPSGNGTEDVELDQDCDICKDPAEDPVVTSCCEHVFCRSCLLDHCGNLRPSDDGKIYPESSLEGVSCPSFDHPLTVDLTMKRNQGEQSNKRPIKGFKRSSILNQICLMDFQSSTKIDALREEIRCMVERDGSAKGIVFSQFTTFLDLISYSLQKSGIKCVQLVGSMDIAARDNAIEKFINDPDCKIFLMSLKAGGVALNLTVASHVFLMDPWWNPAVERQAQDRIHRIGQYKPIRIVRFVIENTIEERILKLQEKKELVFEGTVGGSPQALGKLTEADLRFLFHN